VVDGVEMEDTISSFHYSLRCSHSLNIRFHSSLPIWKWIWSNWIIFYWIAL